MQRLILFLVFVFVSLVPVARADEQQLARDVEKLFHPAQLWLDVKLAADRLVDPTADHSSAKITFEKMSAALKDLVQQKQPQNAHEKLAIMRSYVYEAGPWNDFRPFVYDMDDPFGKTIANKTLAHYIRTRKGNCVSMPILLTLLGREIGLDMTLATAPLHVFAKLKDEDGRVWNIEATSGGGYARDLHYRRELPMSDKAVENGLYMRQLSEKESFVVMTTTVVESLVKQQRWDDVAGVSDVLLKQDAKQVYPMIARASAYGKFVNVLQRANRAAELPMAKEQIQFYYELNQQGFAQAESLGWTEKDGLKEHWPPYEGVE